MTGDLCTNSHDPNVLVLREQPRFVASPERPSGSFRDAAAALNGPMVRPLAGVAPPAQANVQKAAPGQPAQFVANALMPRPLLRSTAAFNQHQTIASPYEDPEGVAPPAQLARKVAAPRIINDNDLQAPRSIDASVRPQRGAESGTFQNQEIKAQRKVQRSASISTGRAGTAASSVGRCVSQGPPVRRAVPIHESSPANQEPILDKRNLPCFFFFSSHNCRKNPCPFSHNAEELKNIVCAKCHLGASCPMKHVIKQPPAAADRKPTGVARPRMQACRYYFTQVCTKGVDCPFSHDAAALSRIDCRCYLVSNCRLGEKCPMRHDKERRQRVPCEHYLKGACKFNECFRNHNDDELKLLRPKAPRYTTSAAASPASISEALSIDDDDEGCCLCLEVFVGNEITLPCLHTYHLHCISPWVAGHHNCPLCRMHIESLPTT